MTSALSIAEGISKQFAGKVVVAKVRYPNGRIATLDGNIQNPEEEASKHGEGWMFFDVTRPFEGDVDLQLFTFDDPEGRETFWHSSAHVLGESLELEFGVHLTHGPPTEDGFFYDSYTGSDIFKEANYKAIEKCAKSIASSKQKFERLVITKENALKMFSANPFKQAIITGKIKDGASVTVYRSGDLIDLCTGPHIPCTKMIKAFSVMKNSAAYWLGKAGNDSLQRVYAVSHPSKKEHDEFLLFRKQAQERDHRRVGRE